MAKVKKKLPDLNLYRILFDNGQTLNIEEKYLDAIFKGTRDGNGYITPLVDISENVDGAKKKLIINRDKVICILPVTPPKKNAYIKPPTARSIKEQEEEEKTKKAASLDKVLADHKPNDEKDVSEG